MSRERDERSPAPPYGVELVHWPSDDVLRQRLARAGVPRLLLVDPDAAAPEGIGLDEDWVRLPSDERDVAARLQRLGRLLHTLSDDRPVVDANRVLHRAGTTVVLSHSEALVVARLLATPGVVVDRAELVAAVWPSGEAPGAKAIDGIIYRLRRRLAGVNLCVRSARNRGFVIYLDDPSDR